MAEVLSGNSLVKFRLSTVYQLSRMRVDGSGIRNPIINDFVLIIGKWDS
jgi:hypothetical protein